MRTFLVAYDLTQPSSNRSTLTDGIIQIGEQWARPLDNVWYVRTSASCSEIEARLAGLLDDLDGLLVQEARGETMLTNTSLRWFRRRRECNEIGNVVSFPGAAAANDDSTGIERQAG